MKLLVVGGTIFVGRHLVEQALERGDEVTLFNRGKSNSDLFPEVETITGDRRTEEGLRALQDRTWDAVIDTCAYFPHDVTTLLDVISEGIGQYTLISSVSVYAPSEKGPDEDSAVIELTDEMSRERVTGENYGALKGAAEEVALRRNREKTLVIRPGLIVGPHDPTDRFTWWPWIFEKGGDVMAPGDLDERIQFIDVRDLARWTLDMVERRMAGTYNAVGPIEPLSMRDFLETGLRTLAPEGTTLREVSEKAILEAEIAPYTELPLWIPASMNSLSHTSVARARAAGLTTRPLETTLRDTLSWFRTTERYATGELRAGGAERILGSS